MKLLHTIALLALLALLGGCASSTPRMAQVRAFAAESSKLGAYEELSQRYRDTYQRMQPYLMPAADAREREQDALRHASYADFIAIRHSVNLYLQTLGALAGDNRFDLEDQVKAIGGGIKVWPDTGLDDRHVNAYSGLTRLLTRAFTAPHQDRAVQAMLREGAEPLAQLLDAMRLLLRYYDKTHDNEQRIVLDTLELEIPFANSPRDHLLSALAKAHQQDKVAEYRLVGRRLTLAAHQLDAIAQAHQALLAGLDPPAQSQSARVIDTATPLARNAGAAAPMPLPSTPLAAAASH
ncbi:hypothetical protein HSX11_00270 [Oxalobacteraceae bacterium]|nr:hypothetical protein [Oxalobacteraceae bacterium]